MYKHIRFQHYITFHFISTPALRFRAPPALSLATPDAPAPTTSSAQPGAHAMQDSDPYTHKCIHVTCIIYSCHVSPPKQYPFCLGHIDTNTNIHAYVIYTCHVPSRVQCPPFAETRPRYQTRAAPPSTHRAEGPEISPRCHPPFRPTQSPGPRFPRQIARGRFEKNKGVSCVCLRVRRGGCSI